MEMTQQDQPEHPENREVQYASFVALLTRHDQVLRRFVRSLLPSAEGVDDVVQETALECWKKFDVFQPASPELVDDEFIRWAGVIARFKALSWQRDRGRDRLVFRDSVVDALAETAFEQLENRHNERHALESCLRKLAEAERRLVLSVYSPGESIAKIAAETGEKARRLYNKLNRLRRLLHDCVENQVSGEISHGS